jgi:cell division transport system ATP-binding protein
MIQIQHLYKTYPGPVHALKNFGLQIGKGEFVFLTGPSGAGKSTLFRMIAAFDRPTSGEIFVGDHDISRIKNSEIPYYRRKIGVIFQDFKLLKNKTVFENVALPLQIREDQQIESKTNAIIEKLGLTHKKNQFPDFISGGEQQRVAIARAMVHQPSLLIADEPTGNLDPQLSEEIMDLLENICNQGTTVFVATHDYSLIKKYKKRQVKISEGILQGDLR